MAQKKYSVNTSKTKNSKTTNTLKANRPNINRSTKIEYASASSDVIEQTLCEGLDEIRLSQNMSQAQLAARSGVSRRTLTRMAGGGSISLDTFIRVMQALGLADQLAAVLPDPSIRPIERVRFGGTERRRASTKQAPARDWQWQVADDADD